MEANQARAPRQRNIRPCTRCNIGHYGPKDDQFQRILQFQPNGDGPVAILANANLPLGIQHRWRKPQQRRVAERNIRSVSCKLHSYILITII